MTTKQAKRKRISKPLSKEDAVSEWKVGDVAVVESYGMSPGIEFHTVSRVMKSFIELDDGSKWDAFGKRLPHGIGYCLPRVRRERPGDLDRLEMQRLAVCIDRRLSALQSAARKHRESDSELSLDELQDLAAKLDEACKSARCGEE